MNVLPIFNSILKKGTRSGEIDTLAKLTHPYLEVMIELG